MEHRFDGFTVTTLVTGRWKANCYLVQDLESQEIAVIDPGDDAEAILEALEEQGGKVRHVVLTHGHYDHLAGAASLCRTKDLPCSVHSADMKTVRQGDIYALAFEKKKIELPESIVHFDLDQKSETYAFPLGKTEITAWPTPGHTPGSICLRSGLCWFTGDTLLDSKVGRTDLPGGDLEKLMASVGSLVNGFPNDAVIFPGHGSHMDHHQVMEWWAAEPFNQKTSSGGRS